MPLLENFAWMLKTISAEEIAGFCLTPEADEYVGVGLDVTGACQDYVLAPVLELPEMKIKHCNDGEVYFGASAPYWMDATVCGTNRH
jgi:hypothetical protein